jgi:hypothetical protein
MFVLCVSVLYGGIGIPVAWKIVPGNQQGAWQPIWCALLRCLQPALGPDWTMVVWTDRGLESARLFREVVAVGWHPRMRAKADGHFRPVGWMHWYAMGQVVPQVGRRFTAAGCAYHTAPAPLAGTLLGCWEEGHDEPWLPLTDLTAAAAAPSWVAFRAWVQQGFKVIKSGALPWQRTRRTKPERAERLWLAITVSVPWLVVIGAAVEGDPRRQTWAKVRTAAATSQPPRQHRWFVLGWVEWPLRALHGRPVPIRTLVRQLWADQWHDVPTRTAKQVASEYLYP